MNTRHALLALLGAAVLLSATPGRAGTDWTRRFEEARRETEGFAVESVEEFAHIHDSYAQWIAGEARVHTFTTRDGAEIACVDIRTQRAARAAGLDPSAVLLTPVDAPAPPTSPAAQPRLDFGLDGTPDERGRARACPVGSFPKLIPPIASFYRYRRLSDRFRKYPAPPGGRAITHEYGIVFAYQDNRGETADFNLWSPAVENDGVFSLAQLWVARGEGDDLQTAEAGWQVLPLLYGNRRANLFIFFTTNAYQSGCYNLDCDAFVQTDSSIVIGAPLDAESVPGGAQTQASIGWVLDGAGGGHWWLTVNGHWVGYYPSGLYDDEGLAPGNTIVNFGGELINAYGTDQCASEMGSGRFPHEGYGRAAYVRRMQYLSTDGDWLDAEGLDITATRPECWGAGDFLFDADPAWRSHFFFGGACGACVGCVTSGTCIPVGDADPKKPCVVCASAGRWAENDGATCDDGAFCNGEDSCLAGTCSEHAGDPCAEGDACVEETDSCEAPGPGAGDDADDLNDLGDDDSDDDDEGRAACGC